MQDAHDRIRGRETEVLDALGIPWQQSLRRHIRCPFPDHEDKNPSWRWVPEKCAWTCSCNNRGYSSVFDAVIRMRGGSFKDAVTWVDDALRLPSQSLPQGKAAVNMQNASDVPPHVPAQKPATKPQCVHNRFGRPVAIYPYPDADRKIYAVVARYNHADGSKDFVPWLPTTSEKWIPRRAPGPWPLFRLPVLLGSDLPVLFVEGEGVVLAAEKQFRGYVVTTTSGGSKHAHGSDFSALKGRRVTIWPDNDEPGAHYASSVARLATEARGARGPIVDVDPAWPRGWDLADPWPESADGIDPLEMLECANLWTAPAPPQLPSSQPGLKVVAGTDAAIDGNTVVRLDPKPTEAGKRPRFLITPLRDIHVVLVGQWLIKSLLPAKGLVVIYGAPGCGKSFLALHAMLHVAAGRTWAGCKVPRAAGVIYIAAEGQSGFGNRVATARDRLQIEPDAPFGLITVAPNGTQKGDAEALSEEIKAQSEVLGWTPKVILVDTLSRTMFGADESSPEGMGSFIANCGLLADRHDALVVAVHHKGKDEARGMRGWSGLHGACDAEWEVIEEDGKHRVEVPKMKDGPDGLTWKFELETVALGPDEEGDPVTTCVVEITSKAQQKSEAKNVARKPLRGQAAEFMKAVKWAIEDLGQPLPPASRIPDHIKGVKREALKKYAENLGFYAGAKPNAQRELVSRHVRTLAGNGYLGQWEEYVWIL